MNRSPGKATARAVIDALRLEPLPAEGGFFRQTWRSETSSAILFLLTPADFSAFHRLDREEVWHFHGGSPVEHIQLDPTSGRVRVSRLGADVLAGEEPQLIVPPEMWQAARMLPDAAPTADFALLGCTVAPPWEDRCFTLGERAALIQAFPASAELIRALTR